MKHLIIFLAVLAVVNCSRGHHDHGDVSIEDLQGTWTGYFTQRDISDPDGNIVCIAPFSSNYTVTYVTADNVTTYHESWPEYTTVIGGVTYTYACGESYGIVDRIEGRNLFAFAVSATAEGVCMFLPFYSFV